MPSKGINGHIRKLAVVVAFGTACLLPACTADTARQTLTGSCNTAASSLRVATAVYKAGKLTEGQARIVDNSAAVIDGFCRPGAPVPVDIASAAQAVSVAGANIVALNLK